jgi:hypothetical protein
MTDRLKLSDLKYDPKAEEAARVLRLADAKERIKELERNNAALEKLLEERARLKEPATSNNKIGARKNSNFKAVSTAPSINKTPRGSAMVPVAYTTTQDLSNSTGVAKAVRFNGDPAYLLDSSKQASCKGDDQGTGGGIRSGTVNGEVKPVNGSNTVKVEGKLVVRQGDPCTMNGGNNPGIYTTVQTPGGAAPVDAIATSNPPVKLDTPQEKSVFKKWLAKAEEELRAAIEHPVEGAKGAAKGLANAPLSAGDLLLKAAAEQRASELDQAAMAQGMFGSTSAASTLSKAARDTRENARKIDLPKFTMNNPAQEGGDNISMAVQIFAGGAGIVKGAVSWLGALGKSGKAAQAAVVRPSVLGGEKVVSSVSPKVESVADGVKVVPRKTGGGASRSGSDTNDQALTSRLDQYKAWKTENGIIGTPSLKEFQLFNDPSRVQSGFKAYANKEWPPDFGALDGNRPFMLLPGSRIDRFGSDFGIFLSPPGTPYSQRALRPGTQNAPYSVFEVASNLEVEAATIKPWFGEVGMGTQFKLLDKAHVKALLESGQLKEVYRGPYDGYKQ